MLPLLLAPAEGEGEAITDRPPRELRILLEHDWLTVTWTRHAVGERGADPHVHLHHVDAFYILEGELALQFGPQLDRVTAGAGSLIMIPPGVVHGFDNDGPGELRFLNYHAPGSGFAEYLRGRDDDFDQQDPPADGGRPASDVLIVPLGGGERFQRRTSAITILGDLPELSFSRLEVGPVWQGIPAHDHDDQVDSFFVLDGQAGLVSGDGFVEAGPGSFYGAPPGARHGIREAPIEGTVFLNAHGPDAGFAAWVRGQ